MISDNNTNLNLSYHPPNPCLLLSLFSYSPPLPPPFPLSLSICIHLHSTATGTHISSDSTGRPVQTRRFLAAISCRSMQISHSRFHADQSQQQISCKDLCGTTTADFMLINHNSRFQADLCRSTTADFMYQSQQQISGRSVQINHSRFHVSITTADFRQIYEDQPQQISCINHNSRFQADL